MSRMSFIGAKENIIGKLYIEDGYSQSTISHKVGCGDRHVRRTISNLKIFLGAKNSAQLGMLWKKYQDSKK